MKGTWPATPADPGHKRRLIAAFAAVLAALSASIAAAWVASGAADGLSGLAEVVLDNPSNGPVGSFAVANTGGWTSWRTVPANISKVTGPQNVHPELVSGARGNPPYVASND